MEKNQIRHLFGMPNLEERRHLLMKSNSWYSERESRKKASCRN
uniref:Uncharacterized protein n=1 Tax=Arundo donax TaxID=35708 RepID=A0A0A8YP41_ARUDO